MMIETSELANELHNYIKFRAAQEGVGYGLTPEFFEDGLQNGCGAFFGVKIDFEDDILLCDNQNPKAFQKFYDV